MTDVRAAKSKKARDIKVGDYLFFTCAFRRVRNVHAYQLVVDISMEGGSNITELRDNYVLVLGQDSLRKELAMDRERIITEMSRSDLLSEIDHLNDTGEENPPVEETVLHQEDNTTSEETTVQQEEEQEKIQDSLGATITGLGVPTDHPVIDSLKLHCAALIDYINEMEGETKEKKIAINHIRSGYLHARLSYSTSWISSDPVGTTPDGYE